MKILIIDDDKLDRMNVIRTLKKSGKDISITESSSAEEGIDFAKQTAFDLILLDYQLPSLNGLEALGMLHDSSSYSTAVIILSHRDDDDLALKCIEAGAQDFIKKSEISVSRLMRAILHARGRYHIEQRLRESREQLRQLAQIDTLTGLANRYMFDKKLKSAISLANRHDHQLALIMLDLDKFKQVNDTLGHVAGDILLREVADRIIKVVRDEDVFCRLGGDEFAILMHCLKGVRQVKQLVERIFNALKQPFLLENTEFDISASLGISTFPECGTNVEHFLKCADIAMYRSKESGRNQAHFYSKEMHEEVLKRVQLEHDLLQAIKRNEFVLHYQPQLGHESNSLVGIEALIRWQHPTRGLILPLDFLTIAEEVGVINDISSWVIETACQQLGNWRRQLNANNLQFSIAVNLSAAQLEEANLFENIKGILIKNQIPPEILELELTESTIKKSKNIVRLLNQLSDFGVKLALDDFGTEFSSIAQLQKHQFQILKIDESFIKNINNENDAIFLQAISAFSKILNVEIIGKGVETQLQQQLCQSLQLDRIQGFYIDKPMIAKEFEDKWLNA